MLCALWVPSWYFGCQIIIIIVFHGQNSELYQTATAPLATMYVFMQINWLNMERFFNLKNGVWTLLICICSPVRWKLLSSFFLFLGAKIEFGELRKNSVQSIVDLWSIKVLRLKMFQCAFVVVATKQRFARCVLHFYCFIGHSLCADAREIQQPKEKKNNEQAKEKYQTQKNWENITLYYIHMLRCFRDSVSVARRKLYVRRQPIMNLNLKHSVGNKLNIFQILSSCRFRL